MTDIVFFGFLLVSFLQDVRKGVLSNRLCAVGVVSALLIRSFEEGWGACLDAMGGALGMVFISLLPWILGAIGGGDAKWFGAAGSFLGLYDAAYLLLLSILCSCVYGIMLLAVSASFRTQLRRIATIGRLVLCSPCLAHFQMLRIPKEQGRTFAFMTAVVPGTVIWYLSAGGAL